MPQDILPLDYALKLLFMFMEIVFRPAYVITVPPLSATCQSLSLSLVSHSCHTIVGPFWPDYPHFVRLIVGFGFDFAASASAYSSRTLLIYFSSLSRSPSSSLRATSTLYAKVLLKFNFKYTATLVVLKKFLSYFFFDILTYSIFLPDYFYFLFVNKL